MVWVLAKVSDGWWELSNELWKPCKPNMTLGFKFLIGVLSKMMLGHMWFYC